MVATLSASQLAHRQATEASVREMAELLQATLSRQVTAYITGVKDGKTVSRWASGEVTHIRDFTIEQRLRTAYQIAKLLLTVDAAPTVRAWYIGMNPSLADISPAQTIREGHFNDALEAAQEFLAYG